MKATLGKGAIPTIPKIHSVEWQKADKLIMNFKNGKKRYEVYSEKLYVASVQLESDSVLGLHAVTLNFLCKYQTDEYGSEDSTKHKTSGFLR
jgi:hypothetical protein